MSSVRIGPNVYVKSVKYQVVLQKAGMSTLAHSNLKTTQRNYFTCFVGMGIKTKERKLLTESYEVTL